jgi:hypothetical protein
MTKAKRETSDQHKRFVEAARALECDEDEAAFDEKLKRIAQAKPTKRIAKPKSIERNAKPR